jgi:ABC-type amino acid transport substrate-binding protein
MKHFVLTLFATSISLCSFAQLKGTSWQKIKEDGKGKLVVAYYEQPGLIQNVNGKMKGVCVDILSDFADFVEKKYLKKIEISYESNQKEFASFLKLVQATPNIIGVTNTSITAERKKILKYTPSYMATPTVLLTHNSVPTVETPEQFSKTFYGFTAEVIAGSTHVKMAEDLKRKHLPALLIKQVGSSDVVLNDLATNNKLFSVLDFTEYVSVVRRQLPIKRHELSLGEPQDLGFIMSLNSDWDVIWNEFLTPEYRKSVDYKKIISDNLGATFLNLVR